jgi:hypothetical protein
MSYYRQTNYRQTKSPDDPLIEAAQMIAEAIAAACGPLFWGFLVIALLTNFFR